MKFENRWKIEGTLTTLSPLRIGDGETIEASIRLPKTYLKADTRINTIAADKNNKPYIPASTIKGNLRAWAEQNVKTIEKPTGLLTPDEIEVIFGSTDPKDENASAGKVQFSNSYYDSIEGVFVELADWNSKRRTAVSAGIAVNRKTRTASDRKLFHQEFVPQGITFKLIISGNDYKITDEDEAKFLTKLEKYPEKDKIEKLNKFKKFREVNNNLLGDFGLTRLLTLLEGFNYKSDLVCIGAETIGLDKSWGQLEWDLTSIKRTNEAAIKSWFDQDSLFSFSNTFKEIEGETRNLWTEVARNEINSVSNQIVEMSLSLQCLDDFLVNDPSKIKYHEDEDHNKKNHSPLRNIDGNPILPKSSIKGAIRCQAEKILRTMAINFNENIKDVELKKIACYPDDMEKACPPIKKIEEVQGLCLACQLFGASGWKSPLSFTDFTATEKFSDLRKEREFVAIDRFTGSVSGGGKFNAEVAHRPLLTGKISFDKTRCDEEWAIGLLALTFRDLLEGDIRFGFGRAKGFGEIKSVVVENHSLVNLFPEFQKELKGLGKFENKNLVELRNSELGLQLQICVEELGKKISGGLK